MPTLGAAAAMKGGILSRALAGSRSFNGGYSSVYSGASKSNFRVTSTQAAKLYYVAFDGKLQQPDQEPAGLSPRRRIRTSSLNGKRPFCIFLSLWGLCGSWLGSHGLLGGYVLPPISTASWLSASPPQKGVLSCYKPLYIAS